MAVLGSTSYIDCVEIPRYFNTSSLHRASSSIFRPRASPAPVSVPLLPLIIATPPGQSSFPSQQESLRPTPVSINHNVDAVDMVEAPLLFREAQILAKSRLRNLRCLWRDCDARLASIDILQKHLDRHITNQLDVRSLDDEANNDSNEKFDAEIRCCWERCSQHGFPTYDALRQHIVLKHITKLVNDHCPHKDCAKKAMPEQIHLHAMRKHPGLWSRDDIRQGSADPHKPVFAPIASRLPESMPRYMVSCPPVAPTHIQTSSSSISPPSRSSRSARSRASPDTTSSLLGVHPIMNIRNPDDFWPMQGEADIHGPFALTSSIFPPIYPIDHNDEEKTWLRIQRTGKYVGESSLTVSKKPRLPRRPLLFTGADVYARRRREELRTEEDAKFESIRAITETRMESGPVPDSSDPKGKRKTVDDISPEPQLRYSIDRITRASANRATRLTGRSIGIARLEEMIPFERRGMELGFLPPDFSLAK